MNENCNVSNELLCKEQIKACVSSSSLVIDCEDTFSTLTQEIDVNKFKTWFERNINTFKTKQNTQIYFKRAFYKELDKGTFKLEEVKQTKIDTSTLVEAMRKKGIKVTTDDTLRLEVMWEELFKAGIKEDVARNLNRHIIAYMKEGDDFQMYMYYVKRSNGLRGITVDWEKIESEFDKELAKANAILNNLSLEVDVND